jgi:hypothetical protein
LDTYYTWTSTPTPIARAAAKAAFTHVMDNVIQNTNVTKALTDSGIDDIVALLILTDNNVDSLMYKDSDPTITTKYPLKKGAVGLIKTFIYFVHYHDEINNPINDQWSTITQNSNLTNSV